MRTSALRAALSALVPRLTVATRPTSSSEGRAMQHIVDQTRRHWAADSRIRIDETPAVRINPEGTWVSAWILTGEMTAIEPAAVTAALRLLPRRTRQVYLLSRDESLTYAQIARRLGIGDDEVRHHVAAALVLLDAALDER